MAELQARNVYSVSQLTVLAYSSHLPSFRSLEHRTLTIIIINKREPAQSVMDKYVWFGELKEQASYYHHAFLFEDLYADLYAKKYEGLHAKNAEDTAPSFVMTIAAK